MDVHLRMLNIIKLILFNSDNSTATVIELSNNYKFKEPLLKLKTIAINQKKKNLTKKY